jgi:hypothetical protein
MKHTQNGALGAEVGHYWLLRKLRRGFGDGSACNYEEGCDNGGDRDHD